MLKDTLKNEKMIFKQFSKIDCFLFKFYKIINSLQNILYWFLKI